MNLYIPYEAEEQTAVFNWAAVMVRRWPELRLLHHIPNGGSLPVARGGWHGLYIEMKRRKGGRLSDEQAAMLEALREQGYCAWVCKGANDAIELITEYLGGE